MSVALEIVKENGDTIDLDRWCHFAKVEGTNLEATMNFGSPVVSTDTEEVVEFKKNEAAENCDKFLEVLVPFVGRVITIIYNATKVAMVKIPENGGLLDATTMIWPLWDEIQEEAPLETSMPDFTTLTPAGIAAQEILLKAMTDLTAAVQELTNAISTKRGN